jgi:hypothetical protein
MIPLLPATPPLPELEPEDEPDPLDEPEVGAPGALGSTPLSSLRRSVADCVGAFGMAVGVRTRTLGVGVGSTLLLLFDEPPLLLPPLLLPPPVEDVILMTPVQG